MVNFAHASALCYLILSWYPVGPGERTARALDPASSTQRARLATRPEYIEEAVEIQGTALGVAILGLPEGFPRAPAPAGSKSGR